MAFTRYVAYAAMQLYAQELVVGRSKIALSTVKMLAAHVHPDVAHMRIHGEWLSDLKQNNNVIKTGIGKHCFLELIL